MSEIKGIGAVLNGLSWLFPGHIAVWITESRQRSAVGRMLITGEGDQIKSDKRPVHSITLGDIDLNFVLKLISKYNFEVK